MKKSGDLAQNYVKKAKIAANLKSGTIGIKIMIMTPDIKLPDKITVLDAPREVKIEEPKVKDEKKSKIIKKIPKKETKKKSQKPKKAPMENKENGPDKKN